MFDVPPPQLGVRGLDADRPDLAAVFEWQASRCRVRDRGTRYHCRHRRRVRVRAVALRQSPGVSPTPAQPAAADRGPSVESTDAGWSPTSTTPSPTPPRTAARPGADRRSRARPQGIPPSTGSSAYFVARWLSRRNQPKAPRIIVADLLREAPPGQLDDDSRTGCRVASSRSRCLSRFDDRSSSSSDQGLPGRLVSQVVREQADLSEQRGDDQVVGLQPIHRRGQQRRRWPMAEEDASSYGDGSRASGSS